MLVFRSFIWETPTFRRSQELGVSVCSTESIMGVSSVWVPTPDWMAFWFTPMHQHTTPAQHSTYLNVSTSSSLYSSHPLPRVQYPSLMSLCASISIWKHADLIFPCSDSIHPVEGTQCNVRCKTLQISSCSSVTNHLPQVLLIPSDSILFPLLSSVHSLCTLYIIFVSIDYRDTFISTVSRICIIRLHLPWNCTQFSKMHCYFILIKV